MSLADLRQEYTAHGLTKSDLSPDPFAQFRIWFDQVVSLGVIEPNAMILATAASDGQPSARTVLLKGLDERGFIFFTNYESRKGQELAQNPRAALILYWAELARQVRIEGMVEQITSQESDAYFSTRPLGSQLGAWVSHQSEIIENRAVLEQRLQELTAEYANRDLPRPPHWGGYRVLPHSIEFWQGRPNRLHDRLRYRCLPEGGWQIERLAP